MFVLSQHLAENTGTNVPEMDKLSQTVLDRYRHLYGENSLEVGKALVHRAFVLLYLESPLEARRMYELGGARFRRVRPDDQPQLAIALQGTNGALWVGDDLVASIMPHPAPFKLAARIGRHGV